MKRIIFLSAHRRRKPIGKHRILVEPSSPRSAIPTHICGATVRLSSPVHYECIKQWIYILIRCWSIRRTPLFHFRLTLVVNNPSLKWLSFNRAVFSKNSKVTPVRSSTRLPSPTTEHSFLGSGQSTAFHHNLSMVVYKIDPQPVPPGIRTVRIDFGVEMLQPASVCYFDDLMLTIDLRRWESRLRSFAFAISVSAFE